MDTRQNPSRPVVSSQLSANRAAQAWLEQNKQDSVKDASGLEWKIVVEMREVPDPVDHRRALFELNIRLEASASAEILIQTGTLVLPDDQRLSGLIGDSTIPFTRKPIYHEAKSIDEARRFLADRVQEIAAEMRVNAFHEIKRQLIGRWVDERARFGGS
jgi:hypothetical protein